MLGTTTTLPCLLVIVYQHLIVWLPTHCPLTSTGGAGGKGTWGSLTDEMYADTVTKDSHDPNYDSDDDDEVCVVLCQ